jgi:heat shock protein HslJ
LTAVTLVGLACDNGSVAPSGPVEGPAWQLVSLQRGPDIVMVPTPQRYAVHFEGGRVAVRSDCNSCSGSYTLNESALLVGALACTRAFCGPDSLDTEFTRALSAATSALASSDTLVLYGDVTLRFSQ